MKHSHLSCPECRGLRQVVKSQGEFILSLKKLISDYSGENQHWERLRSRRGKSS